LGDPITAESAYQPDSVYGTRRRNGSAAWLYQEVTEDPEGGFTIGEGPQSQSGEISMSKHIGSKFDDFLDEEGLLAETEAVAAKRVIAFQLRELMKKQKLTKVQLAKRMNTSRSALERLLDPENVSVTLLTLERAARALGKSIRIELAA